MKEKCGEILVLALTEGGRIHPVAYELLHKGQALQKAGGQRLTSLLVSAGGVDPADLCRRGAETVYHMEDPCFAVAEESLLAANIAAFLEEHRPDVVLTGATPLGRSLAPRIAAALRTGLTADCTELLIAGDGALEQVRPAFSDHILAHIRTKTRPQMATVRYKEFAAGEPDPAAPVRVVPVPAYMRRSAGVTVEQLLPIEGVDITEAEVIVAGGRGIRKAEDLALLQDLAGLLGGQVGVSRALVDAGMAPGSRQVGYSGNRVKPRLYIACGISGAPQHLAGMKEADTIIAINQDPSAPIFRICDIGYVGDLYQVIPALIQTLKKEARP